MSMPTFPKNAPPLSREGSLNEIIASIAAEELSLSHILNAEGEKLQYVLGTSLTQPDDSQGRPHGSRQQRRTKRIIEDLQGNFVVIVQTQQDLVGKPAQGQCCYPSHSGPFLWFAVDQQPGAGGQGLFGIDDIPNLINPGGFHGEFGVVWADGDALGLHLVTRQRHQAIHGDCGRAGVSGIGKVDDDGAGGTRRTGGARRPVRAE